MAAIRTVSLGPFIIPEIYSTTAFYLHCVCNRHWAVESTALTTYVKGIIAFVYSILEYRSHFQTVFSRLQIFLNLFPVIPDL
jgi:hypothetical protein